MYFQCTQNLHLRKYTKIEKEGIMQTSILLNVIWRTKQSADECEVVPLSQAALRLGARYHLRSSMFDFQSIRRTNFQRSTKGDIEGTLHALNPISCFNARRTYNCGDVQKRETNHADITQGKQNNSYDRSVFDRTIVTKQLSDSARDTR